MRPSNETSATRSVGRTGRAVVIVLPEASSLSAGSGMGALVDDLQEVAMEASVVGQFRMERGCQQVPLPRRHHGAVVQSRQHLGAGADFTNDRCADEDRMVWPALDRRDGEVRL